MLKVTYNFTKIEVRFYHRICTPTEIGQHTGFEVDGNRRCSLVTVSISNPNEAIIGHERTDYRNYHGMAICNPSDNFCRASGRKKALAEAMFPLPKEVRKIVWAEYNIQCGF